MRVIINDSKSDVGHVQYGVPQGSCVGPVIFTLYTAALSRIVEKYPTVLHGYADDHKVAFSFRPGDKEGESRVLKQLDSCFCDIVGWMTKYKLKMNQSKTEIIIYGTKSQLAKVNIKSVKNGDTNMKCVGNVRDLGVIMENNLSFNKHIKKCQTANIQLRNLKCIRRYLTKESTEVLVNGLVHSHLDFCNGLFTNNLEYLIEKLQMVQNNAARIVINKPYVQSVSEMLKSLHWLPIRARIEYKALVQMYRVINGTAPLYIHSLFYQVRGHYRLRSSDNYSFAIPRTRTRLSDRSVSCAGPRWWNSLPKELECVQSESTFKKKLKTFLFNKHYQ